MQKIKLKEIIEHITERLSQSNKKEKTVKNCITGLRNIVRFFDKKGIYEIRVEQLDEFLLEMHNEHISGKFAIYKWRDIRRGCEMIKLYTSEGTIDIGILSRWDYSRGSPKQYITSNPPTTEQLSDHRNIYALAWAVRQKLIEAGLTANTVRHYSEEGLDIIIRCHYAQKTDVYSKEISEKLIYDKRKQYEAGQTRWQSYQFLRKSVCLVDEMYETGKISLETIPRWNLRKLTIEFSNLLSAFHNAFLKENRLTESSINTLSSKIRQFLFALEDTGVNSVKMITPILVNTIATKLAVNYPSGAGAFFYAVRLFLQFLYEKGVVDADLSTALPEAAVSRKTFHEPFTDDEVKRLLEAPDRSTSLGKRDHAIMLLALKTGLRACDIAGLKRENIDWRNRTINFVQHKTGVALSLPIFSESANAIADYLLHCRPESDLPYVFLCNVGKKRPLNSSSLNTIVGKYMKRTGIYDPKRRRGIHSFRRTFGTNLLKCDIPMELIQQLLGHTQMNSMKPYLSVEEEGLKRCALSLVYSSREEARL